MGRFFGWVLCIGGGLLLLISGGCTSVAFVMGLTEDAGFAIQALALGAPAIAISAAVIWAGRKLLRSS